jgi:hypothetical protein
MHNFCLFYTQFFVICMQLFPFYTQLPFHSTSSILYTKFCILYTTFSTQLFLFYIQRFVLATFYFQPQSNKKTYCGLIVSTIDQSSNGASVSMPYFVFHITYYYSLLQKIDEEAIEYILEVIHSVINVVNRLIESGDSSMDFQVLAMKLDYEIIYSDLYLLV